MNGRPPQLSPRRLLVMLLLPLAAYLLIRAFVHSPAKALALSEVVPSGWLLLVGVTQRRLDRGALVSALTVAIALAAYAFTGGNPLAIELRRGTVTGSLGIATLLSVAIRRPLLLLVAEHVAKMNPEQQPVIEARLAEPQRRRALAILTAIIGLAFTLDGTTQTALAFTVPTGSFAADSTAVRIIVLGTGLVAAVWYFRYQKQQRENGRPK